MIPNFAKQKYQWLDQVAADATLMPLAFKVAYRIAAYVNQETGEAWPSQARLAEECHVGRTGLRDAIRALADGGHLEVSPGAGRVHTSRYRWVIRSAKTGRHGNTISRENGSVETPIDADKGPLKEPVEEGTNGSAEQPIPGLNGSLNTPDPDVNGSVEPPVQDGKGSLNRPSTGRKSGHQRVAKPATINLNEQLEGTIPVGAQAPLASLADVRTTLFRDGRGILMEITGKPDAAARKLIGRWLRDNGDDAKRVLRAIEDARDERAVDPIPWIEAALRHRGARRQAPTDSLDFAFARH